MIQSEDFHEEGKNWANLRCLIKRTASYVEYK